MIMMSGSVDYHGNEDYGPAESYEGIGELWNPSDYKWRPATMGSLIGEVFVSYQLTRKSLALVTRRGEVVRMVHHQDCCECVAIDDICGDLNDLIGVPVLSASERVSRDSYNEGTEDGAESFKWTFYDFGTSKGYVTIRWFGESNGYYSESVDIEIGRKK